jgi:hypothetical protein
MKFKNKKIFNLVFVALSLALVFVFQNCSGKKIYDYASVSSTTAAGSPTTNTSGNNPQDEVCSINASVESADVGENVTWTLSTTLSLPSGFKILWRRQSYDIKRIDLSNSSELNTNLQKSETFTEFISEISYSAEFQTNNGALLCATSPLVVMLIQKTFNVDSITVSKEFVVPAGVTQIRVTAVGGGGGGGAGHFNVGVGGGGGGGGGGRVVQQLISVSPGQIIPVTVGLGGIGGRYTSTRNIGIAFNGSDGATTSFGALVIAKGGGGGLAGVFTNGSGKGGTGGGSGGGWGNGQSFGLVCGNGGKAGASSTGNGERIGLGSGWNFATNFSKSILTPGDGGVCANSPNLFDGGGGGGGLIAGSEPKAFDGTAVGAAPGAPGKGGVGYGAGGGGGSGTLGVGGAGHSGIVYLEWD